MHDANRLLELLDRHWGYRSFRPLQQEAIEAICARRDSVVVLPTGGGKSVCYQLPALDGDGLALVVSPLISLMKDQVDVLVGNGVPAAAVNSSMPAEERDRILADIDRLRLLYVSPERLAGDGADRFLDRIDRARLDYVAIDEAHCISHWGHDFRPEYRRLGQLRDRYPDISIHAFTATATERVRGDIAAQLALRDPTFLVGSFDRPNLVYRVLGRDSMASQVRRVARRHEDEGGIVYCMSRKETERLADRLSSWGHSAAAYHAGLEADERARVQDAFLEERVDIVVATVAFGMGIDRSNVRFVVHAGSPRSLEHYQQEAGRAGRDGLEAECVLITSPADFVGWRRLLQRDGELSPAQSASLRQMERYATGVGCRHRALVEHFGQSLDAESCGACDWCLGEIAEVESPTLLARKILSGVARLRSGFGAGHVIAVLRGQDTERVRARGHDGLSTYGLLSEQSVGELRSWIDQLIGQGHLVLQGDQYPTLGLTDSGIALMRGELECRLHQPPRPVRRSRGRARDRAAEASWEGVDEAMFEALRSLRTEIARERGVPPYVVFHDTTLRELARDQPTSRAALLEVRGIGDKKADDLGERVLTVIAGVGVEA